MDWRTLRQAVVEEYKLPNQSTPTIVSDVVNRGICLALADLRPESLWLNTATFSFETVIDQTTYVRNNYGQETVSKLPWGFWGVSGEYLSLDQSKSGTAAYRLRPLDDDAYQRVQRAFISGGSGLSSWYRQHDATRTLEIQRPPGSVDEISGMMLVDLGTPVPRYDGNAWTYEIVEPDGSTLATGVSQALQEDASGAPDFVDITADINDVGVDDAQPFPAGAGINDAVYFGFEKRVGVMAINTSTAGVGTYTLVWEYWNGLGFVGLAGVVDGTVGFKTSGNQTLNFTLPEDWAETSIDSGPELFFLRARRDGGTVTTDPLLAIAVGPSAVDTNLFSNEWFREPTAQRVLITRAANVFFSQHERDAAMAASTLQAWQEAVAALRRQQGPMLTMGEIKPWMGSRGASFWWGYDDS